MYLVILNYSENTTEVLFYNSIEGHDDPDFDINDWLTLKYSDNIDYMICDYLNIQI